jgi:SAM-dependent methyltransferase
METAQTITRIYTDGSYLAKTGGTWHLEDSQFKARCIMRMLARHPEFHLRSVAEVGCGAGGILSALQRLLPDYVIFTGYEISPQAHTLSLRFANSRCRYILGDAFSDHTTYDLVLVMDVVEHVEDCFSFMRQARQKGRLKLYHIPLDVHVQGILRGSNQWDAAGHIHLYTAETALKSVEYTGHRVVDWFLTDVSLERGHGLRTRLANLARRPLGICSRKLAARLLGGYSILVLAE